MIDSPLPNTRSATVVDWTTRLLADGYCIIPDLASSTVIFGLNSDCQAAFRDTLFCQGAFYGERTKRFGRLLIRSAHAAALVQHPLIIQIARAVLNPWCDTIQLNLTQAIELHPGALPQLPHRDQDMWQGDKGRMEYLVNVIWPLTPFRRENGATVIWPGSHGKKALGPNPEGPGVVAECAPGSAILFLGSTLHGAGGNDSEEIRRGLIVSYSLGWLKPYENQWLAYPPAIAKAFPPELAALVGYRQHRPNLGNFEGNCPSILLRDQLPERLGAIDALRPDQHELITDYVSAQRQDAGKAPQPSKQI